MDVNTHRTKSEERVTPRPHFYQNRTRNHYHYSLLTLHALCYYGRVRGLNPGPPPPKGGIIPLDQPDLQLLTFTHVKYLQIAHIKFKHSHYYHPTTYTYSSHSNLHR